MSINAKPGNHLSSALFVMVLVGYPISAGLTALSGIETSALSVVYRALVLIPALFLIMVSLYREKLRLGIGIILGAAFAFYYAARMLLENMLSAESSNIDWSDFWVFFVLVCFLPALPFVWKINSLEDLFTRRGLMFFGVIGLVAGFYLAHKASDLSIWGQLFSGRLESERLNPIAFGHLAVSVLIVGMWGLIIKREKSVLAAISLLVGGFGLFASGSRGPFLSFAVCCVLILLLIKNRLIWSIALCFAVGLVLFLSNGISGISDDVYLLDRVANSMFEDGTRVALIEEAYHAFAENFMFGAAYPFNTYPHNIIIEAFMSSGIVGGLLMMGMLSVGGVAAIRLFNSEFAWVALLFIQYLVFVMVSGSIYYSNIFWLLWVCVLTLAGCMQSAGPLGPRKTMLFFPVSFFVNRRG